MGQIFISYSRRDTETVDRIAEAMKDAGMDIWIDREAIQAGNQWRVQIVEAIDTCDAFILMLSPNSSVSDNVRKEIDLAQDSGRKIFAIMLEPVKLPAEIRYQLAGLQFIDIIMLGFEMAIRQLIDVVSGHVAKLKAVVEEKTREAELVIKGIDLKAFSADMQEQLLDFVAQISNTNRTGLAVTNLAAGSVHVFINMPSQSAFELKTLALNRDKRFKKFSISSLRLAGDSKFVNISLGILTVAATLGFLQTFWLSTPSMLVSVVGVTAGKALTLSAAVVVTAGLVVSAPEVITPLLSLPPTPTRTLLVEPVLSSQSTQSILLPLKLTDIPALTPTFLPETSTLGVTASMTPTPENPLVLEDTVCWFGPGPEYQVVGALRKDTRVEVLGRSEDGNWLVVEHPVYNAACWMRVMDLQVDLSLNILIIEVSTPPVPPPPTARATRTPIPYTVTPSGPTPT